MSIVVFAGPTIDARAGRELLDAKFLPPASQGDIYRAGRRNPSLICLIDGTFERAPAVWHKEILWCLSRGIHVLGASSMGALRAAELWPFGMVGVGKIFEWLKDGTVEDDDEVAVAHSDAEHGFRATSEALVNVRATLQAAEAAGAIDRVLSATLLSLSRAQFYPDRSYPSLIERARAAGVLASTLRAFTEFLERGKVNQKQLDARALLRFAAENQAAFSTPFVPNFHFEHTETWQQLMTSRPSRSAPVGDDGGDDALDGLREELRLSGLLELARRGALLRAQAVRQAQARGFVVAEERRAPAREALRREQRLGSDAELAQFLGRNALSDADFTRLSESNAVLRWFEALYGDEADEHLRTEMILGGYYASLRGRAEEKERLLAARGASSPDCADAGLSLDELTHWYVHVRLQQPEGIDVMRVLEKLGFGDLESFVREALREYLFLKYRSTPS